MLSKWHQPYQKGDNRIAKLHKLITKSFWKRETMNRRSFFCKCVCDLTSFHLGILHYNIGHTCCILWGWLKYDATPLNSYNPLFWMVARNILYEIIHFPTYLGQRGQPSLIIKIIHTNLYKLWDNHFDRQTIYHGLLSFFYWHFHVLAVIFWQFGTSCTFMKDPFAKNVVSASSPPPLTLPLLVPKTPLLFQPHLYL